MKILVALLAVLAGSVPASAGSLIFEWKGMDYALAVPPAHWFSKPLLAPLTVQAKDASYVSEICSNLVGRPEDMGCTSLAEGSFCIITINADMTQRMYAAVLHHETAHCHGWPADHPED